MAILAEFLLEHVRRKRAENSIDKMKIAEEDDAEPIQAGTPDRLLTTSDPNAGGSCHSF